MSQVVINVNGMSCGHCVKSVEGALNNLSGVAKAVVSLEQKNVAVDFDETKVNVDTLKEAIEEQGYDVV